jgi:penicillin-binding protein-related factor A (putative recombinase)
MCPIRAKIPDEVLGPKKGTTSAGKKFQRAVLTSCLCYENMGVGLMKEIATPYRRIGVVGGGRLKGRPIIAEETSTVDFSGWMFGVPMAIECKSFKDDRIDPGHGGREFIHEHQVEFLEAWERGPKPKFRFHHTLTVGIILVELRKSATVWALRPAVYRSLIAGRKSIPLKVLCENRSHILGTRGAFEVPTNAGNIPVDFAEFMVVAIREAGLHLGG